MYLPMWWHKWLQPIRVVEVEAVTALHDARKLTRAKERLHDLGLQFRHLYWVRSPGPLSNAQTICLSRSACLCRGSSERHHLATQLFAHKHPRRASL